MSPKWSSVLPRSVGWPIPPVQCEVVAPRGEVRVVGVGLPLDLKAEQIYVEAFGRVERPNEQCEMPKAQMGRRSVHSPHPNVVGPARPTSGAYHDLYCEIPAAPPGWRGATRELIGHM